MKTIYLVLLSFTITTKAFSGYGNVLGLNFGAGILGLDNSTKVYLLNNGINYNIIMSELESELFINIDYFYEVEQSSGYEVIELNLGSRYYISNLKGFKALRNTYIVGGAFFGSEISELSLTYGLNFGIGYLVEYTDKLDIPLEISNWININDLNNPELRTLLKLGVRFKI